VVDDAPDSRLIIKSVLQKLGYQVTTANDGEEAWELLNRCDDFQIVISDWVMPKLDGLGLCQRIRQEPFSKYTYIILLTGMSGKTNLISGIAAGADDFATKPINTEELEIRLRSARRILELEHTLAQQNEALARANVKLQVYATTDDLTGLYNRRAFQEHLEKTLLFSRRTNETLSLLMVDVDYFKAYNDTFGHVEGDIALKIVAKLLKDNSRSNDFVARFGGEEFTVILPNTEMRGARFCAEELREAVANHPWMERNITVSIGVTTVAYRREQHEDTQEMYSRILSEADQALYRSKSTGRNKVTHFRPRL